MFSGDIRVFCVYFAEVSQEIVLFLFLKRSKIEKSFSLAFSADYLAISVIYLFDRIAMSQM